MNYFIFIYLINKYDLEKRFIKFKKIIKYYDKTNPPSTYTLKEKGGVLGYIFYNILNNILILVLISMILLSLMVLGFFTF